MTHSQMNVHDSFFKEVLGDSSTCNYCGKELLEDFLDGVPSARVTAQLNASKDCPGMCEQCIVLLYQADFRQWPSGDLLDAPCTPTEQSPTPPVEDSPFSPSIDLMPTKIKALVADLTEHAPLEKSVVFSYRTYTLDLVQGMLDAYGIAYTRIDGKTSLLKRSEVMDLFQKGPGFRVILVSITCGGAGLDLTAASRAYLLEPHWNPMIEEQALCLVHRVGQSRTVTTIRYLMRISFEEPKSKSGRNYLQKSHLDATMYLTRISSLGYYK